MTVRSHPTKTSCHSQTELTKQSRGVPPTRCRELLKGDIRGHKSSDVWGQAFTNTLSRDVQNPFSFPCGCGTNLLVLLAQLFFFYTSIIGSLCRKSFSAVHQELACEQEFVPVPCNECWLVTPAACERQSAFSGHGNSSDSRRAGGGGDSRHPA